MPASTKRSRWKRRRRRSSCRTATSAAPTRHSSRSASRSSRVTEAAMDRFAHYAWPFFEPKHEQLGREAESWARDNLTHAHGDDADAVCKRLVQDLGGAGYLSYSASESPDVRSIALL